ncbi:ATP-dependent Clp protease ATP-binding subunit clpX-like, mitochondrial [Trichonephila clavipes]|nr:ATP-dependent Clp protease ATP-binding subunit clpX-like, mitochondrial [Trichonephila clavipes]
MKPSSSVSCFHATGPGFKPQSEQGRLSCSSLSGLIKEYQAFLETEQWRFHVKLTRTSTHAPQENILLEAMFEIPGSDIASVRVTSEVVQGLSQPLYIRKEKVEKKEYCDNDVREDQERAVNT